MNKPSKQLLSAINKLPKILGYKDPQTQRDIKVLFCKRYLCKYNKWTGWLTSYSIMIYTKGLYQTILKNIKSTNRKKIAQPIIYHQTDALNLLASTSSAMVINAVFAQKRSRYNKKIQKVLQPLSNDDLILVFPAKHVVRAVNNKDIIPLKYAIHDFLRNMLIGQISLLLDSSISAYKIQKMTNIDKSTIIRLRNKDRSIFNLTAQKALQLGKLDLYSYRLHQRDLSKPSLKVNRSFQLFITYKRKNFHKIPEANDVIRRNDQINFDKNYPKI